MTHTTISPVDATAKALDALLTAIDQAPSVGAVTAYNAAIARHGRNLLDTAGPEALNDVVARIRSNASDKAAGQDRERTVMLAWQDLAA